jgi:hypothetical protein
VRALSILFGTAMTALVLVVSAGAKGPGPQTTPSGIGGYLVSPWPPAASQLAKELAKASFARKYETLWGYLHPADQKAVSQSHWQHCQGAHPAAPPSVSIRKVSIANSAPVPVTLPLLGHKTVREVQLQIQFTTPAASGTQYALEYTFLLKQGSKWLAVWLADEYAALKAGRCYQTPQGPGLY